MEFRRLQSLPPYVFAQVNEQKIRARRRGEDIIDLGFGNPDLPCRAEVVDKLVEAAQNPRNHGYSASRGLPKLRLAMASLYKRRFGVELDPETEVVNTIGAKEGLSHVLWTLVQPGDAVLVPEPSYPIHLYAPVFAGAEVRRVPLSLGTDFFGRMEEVFRNSWPRPRVIIVSFPHNPTGACVTIDFFEKLVAFAKENEVILIHDFAYADIAFDGFAPPSLLQVQGAREVGIEIYSLSKGYSMAGWRVGFVVGNREIVAALAKLKSYLDYGTFQPIQIASIIALNEGDGYAREMADIYRVRRDVLLEGLNRSGWDVPVPQATMFVWAAIPEPQRKKGSLQFSLDLLKEAKVAVSPGIGFGPSGDPFVRFALVENEQRINQAVRGIRKALTKMK